MVLGMEEHLEMLVVKMDVTKDQLLITKDKQGVYIAVIIKKII